MLMDDEVPYAKATFAAGCFWGVEAAFRRLDGVAGTIAGYTGGTTSRPTYEQVCRGRTGHAEAVQVLYDDQVISYEHLLGEFFALHDPTQLNRQGPDVGTKYRSAIFYHTPEQKAAAEAFRDRLQGSAEFRGRTIVTEIVPAGDFWPAEEYHQQYYEKCGRGFCATRQLGG